MTRFIARLSISATVAAALVVFLGASAPANAQMSRNRVNRVERKQQAQIRMGVRNGTLSKREAARLERHAKDIKAAETKDNISGSPTPQERQQLKRDLERQQQAIKGAEGQNPKPVATTPPAGTAPAPTATTPPLG